MGYLFVFERLVEHSITSIDSTLLKAKAPVWHKSSMKKGAVLRPGIDRDARWGFNRTKGWIFGYKLHLTYSIGCCGAFNSRDVTTANIQDNQMYLNLTSLPVFSLPYVLFIIADLGYDAKGLYKYSKKVLGLDLVCLVERYKNTPKERLELVCLYQSTLGQAIYSKRRISIEPLIQHIKSVFRIDVLPVRGFNKVSAIVLLSFLLYQISHVITVKLRK